MSESTCHACEGADYTCPDCHVSLCVEHRCDACGRCPSDCTCLLPWWVPDLFGLLSF